MLEQYGYSFDETLGFWKRPDFSGISYSDGDVTENSIASAIIDAVDISVLSEELGRNCVDWPTTYHLSPLRANLLRPLASLFDGDVLEIGSGCGAITRFLGECGGNILALEGSTRRAAITRSRTRELSNVTVIAENFDLFECEGRFDIVTMIGVLEYANLYMSGENAALSMLKKAFNLLKPQGKLIIAIENQLGLKYFAGAPEDHLGASMYGIEGRYQPSQPKTFGRVALTDQLRKGGFVQCEFLAPFPDYKLPVSIISEHGFAEPLFDASAFAWQSVDKDPQLPRTLNFSPILTWPIVAQNNLALDLANSFLVIASKDNIPSIDENNLAWHFSSPRKKSFCKASHFVKSDNLIKVKYFRPKELPSLSATTHGSCLINSIETSGIYELGDTLSWHFLRTLSKENWGLEDVLLLGRKYLEFIREVVSSKGHIINALSSSTLVPGYMLDCIPQNIIVKNTGEMRFIDQEWISPTSLDLGHLFLRGLMPFLSSVAPYSHASINFDGTRRGLLQLIASNLDIPLTDEKINDYLSKEAEIQREAHYIETSAESLKCWLNEALPLQVSTQECLKFTSAKLAESIKSLENTNRENRELHRQISTLKETIADLKTELSKGILQINALEADEPNQAIANQQKLCPLDNPQQKVKEESIKLNFISLLLLFIIVTVSIIHLALR